MPTVLEGSTLIDSAIPNIFLSELPLFFNKRQAIDFGQLHKIDSLEGPGTQRGNVNIRFILEESENPNTDSQDGVFDPQSLSSSRRSIVSKLGEIDLQISNVYQTADSNISKGGFDNGISEASQGPASERPSISAVHLKSIKDLDQKLTAVTLNSPTGLTPDKADAAFVQLSGTGSSRLKSLTRMSRSKVNSKAIV